MQGFVARRAAGAAAGFAITTISAAVLIVLMRGAMACAAPGQISAIDTLGGEVSRANAIDEAGVVVGWADTTADEKRAIRWQNGVVTNLQTLGGNESEAVDINESGVIVGYARNASGYQRGFRYDGAGPMQDIGVLGGNESTAAAVNDAGVIVGSSDFRAFRLPPGGPMSDVSMANGTSYGIDINNAGVVAGHYLYNSHYHAFQRIEPNPSADLGGVASSDYFTFDINTAGHIVGRVSSGASFSPFHYVPGNGFVAITGSPNTQALAINDLGAIVGQTNSASDLNAILWRPNGTIQNLEQWLNSVNPTEGAKWTLTSALDISNSGLVVGYGDYDADGAGPQSYVVRGFVLDGSPLVPEPASAALLIFPALAFVATLRRR